MKKCMVWLLSFCLLSGCAKESQELEKGMELRSKLQNASSCSFTAHITADYGDKLHIFTLNCTGDPQNELSFTVKEPESISGISGTLSPDGGALSFSDTALHFPLLADGQLSPISAPWTFLHALSSGYITSACTEDGQVRLSLEDYFEDTSLRLDIWLSAQNTPAHADILYEGRRILSVDVEEFVFL